MPEPTVEVESRRADIAGGKLLVERFAGHVGPVGLGADIAVAVFVLDDLQLVHQAVDALFEPSIPRRRPHQADAQEVMPGDMAGQLAVRAIPAAVAFGLGRQARLGVGRFISGSPWQNRTDYIRRFGPLSRRSVRETGHSSCQGFPSRISSMMNLAP
jgi:hypothetical protein